MISGFFHVTTLRLPTIPGPEAVLALAIWNTSAPSWAAMEAAADSDTRAGVIAFVNPVTIFTVNPPLRQAAFKNCPWRLRFWAA